MWNNVRFSFFFSITAFFSSAVVASIFWVVASVISIFSGSHATELITSDGKTVFLSELNFVMVNIGIIVFSFLVMWLFSKLSVTCFKKALEISKHKSL